MWKLLILLLTITIGEGIVVDQHNKDSITSIDGNCFGDFSYFLCNCFNDTETVDLQISEGVYHLKQQPSLCLLNNKANISISGLGPNVTIYCENFNFAILNSSNINFNNLQLINCGHFVDEYINATYVSHNPSSYFGQNFRFFVMIYNSFNATFTDVSMLNTLGYSIIFVNVRQTINLFKLRVLDTTFENDPKCTELDYNGLFDFLCSGSGVMIINPNRALNVTETNVHININHCQFKGNKNILPAEEFKLYIDLVTSGYYLRPVPLIGAGCITVYYSQSSYNVTTKIINSVFQNNHGTFSATVALSAISSISGRTIFDNCLFEDGNRVGNVLDTYYRRSGIVFYYIQPLFIPGLTPMVSSITQIEMVTVSRSNFTKLGGNNQGRFGGAIQLEKISPDLVSVVVTIKQCRFIANEAIGGSAIFAKNSAFYLSTSETSHGGLHINLEDITVNYNTLPPNGNIYYATGVIYFVNCQINLTCNEQCNFMHNQPSAIYGQNGAISVAGNLSLQYNRAVRGGAMTLRSTVLYVKVGSAIYFGHNYAISWGGAMSIRFFSTGIQAQDVCPIQFFGTGLITSYSHLHLLNVNITFEGNYVGDNTSLESIVSGVFYLCTWYPGTSVGIASDELVPVINNTRISVYRQVLTFIPSNKVNEHLSIFASVPCLCNINGIYSNYATACLTKQIINWSEPVIPGWTFTLNMTALTAVGDVGFSHTLTSRIDEDNGSLVLEGNELQRPFSPNKTTCIQVGFTVYVTNNETLPASGLLSLAIGFSEVVKVLVKTRDCPAGYKMQAGTTSDRYGCNCNEFFSLDVVRGDFQCLPGKIVRIDLQSWLAKIGHNLEYAEYCLPTYCNHHVTTFRMDSSNVLCSNNHAGRACGGCVDGYSRVFGSSVCKRCSNVWLTTILLYGLLGVLLVFLIYKLQFTVTVGAINGLAFFCNCMSINQELFFNTTISRFSFLRIFVSIINLELGFEICFYDEMSQLVKTGLQFVFPAYLWLLVIVVVYLGKYYFRNKKSFSYSIVSVLATLFLLSYLKILRTIIEIYSPSYIHSSDGTIIVWRPDPNITYFTGFHIFLFIIASLFLIGFIIPFAIGFTFPKIVFRSKQLSRLFPLVDSFVAPYKHKYRYWFGLRALILILMSIIEAVASESADIILVISITAVSLLVAVQAQVRPFKSALINSLDILFMELFVVLSVLSLFFYPTNDSGYGNINISVTVFGYCAFLLFLVLVVCHLHSVYKEKLWYRCITGGLMKRCEQFMIHSTSPSAIVNVNKSHPSVSEENDDGIARYDYYRESLLEHF